MQRSGEFISAEQKTLAAQAARREASRNLTTQIHDFRLADDRTIGPLIEQDDAARTYVESLVRDARVIETKTLPDRSTQVRVAAELTIEGQACLMRGDCPQPPGCDSRPQRKVLVTAFPLRYPEQIHTGEFMGWPQATAEELARLLERGGKLQSIAAPQRFPFESTESAPEQERKQGVPVLTRWADEARAQYVVAGLFRDFGMAKNKLVIPSRQLVMEAFIYDGITGELLARREFSRQLAFSWEMPKTITPGTREFNTSRLGKLFYEVLGNLTKWTESTVSCLPFSARVIHVEGSRLHLDVGSDSGIEPGMELVLTRTEGKPITTADGDVLAGERVPVAGVIVKSVQARYSVAEITAKKNPPVAKVGDVLYGL